MKFLACDDGDDHDDLFAAFSGGMRACLLSERVRGEKECALNRPPQPGPEAGVARNRSGAAFTFVAVFDLSKGWLLDDAFWLNALT